MTEQKQPRDTNYWAQQVGPLKVGDMPKGALNLNVEGRRVASPLQGFGKMWQKTYKLQLEGADVSPEEVIEVWKRKFAKFFPKGALFHSPSAGITPGEVALLGSDMTGSRWIATGIMVLYADAESFTYMCPEGHPFSGWVTFSSHRDEEGVTVAQVHLLIRATDPLYELMMPLALHKVEDDQWQHVLGAVANHFGATGRVEMNRVCVDRKRQWRNYKNVRHNAMILSLLHALAAPFRGRRN
jgi:hypothetical protein